MRLPSASPLSSLALMLVLPLLLAAPPRAGAQTPLDIEQAMADPDWIGPPVESAWWAWDGRRVQYTLKRAGGDVRDVFEQPVDGGAARQVEDGARAGLDAPGAIYDATRSRMLFLRNGDVFLRDLDEGALTQITRDGDAKRGLAFGTEGSVIWHVEHDAYRWTAATGAVLAASLRPGKDPAADPEPDALRAHQMRTIATLQRDHDRARAVREHDRRLRHADPTRAPAPVYLGEDLEIVDSALSPDARWLLAATQPRDAEGQTGRMPKYVTESGYEDFETVRTRVGRKDPPAQRLWLVDLAAGTAKPLDLAHLPGIGDDPLAALRKAAGKPALQGARAVRLGAGEGEAGVRWSEDGHAAALLLRAVDNKDRWIVTLDPAEGRLRPRDRLTDAAWINWRFNEFGWLADGRTLWWLSEASGHSHLYTLDTRTPRARPRQRTSGEWEVSAPVPTADGGFLFLCNRAWPGDYEVCRLDAAGERVAELTALDGVENFALSPDGERLLVRHSRSYLPPQLSVLDARGGPARTLTDTRSAAFRAREWIEPEMVRIPSRHGAGEIWGKYYGPARLEPGRRYPIVMFVHGAGYLQNVSARYPNYFREQMFHHLLVQRGYVVLDLDYRGSAGYGRDWRTAIHRRMGHPELEDYLDGLEWLAEHRQGDRDRAGIYGGSYGGFMTLMALFRAPGAFKAGAALRPVTDWRHYNHGYTSNILNTPELDPEAYDRSSPIGYAEGLQGGLLIAHGMMDDNVFYQDSVLLAQRLIELRKDDWELASYPLERHGYLRADSWLDQYKRILKLFETA